MNKLSLVDGTVTKREVGSSGYIFVKSKDKLDKIRNVYKEGEQKAFDSVSKLFSGSLFLEDILEELRGYRLVESFNSIDLANAPLTHKAIKFIPKKSLCGNIQDATIKTILTDKLCKTTCQTLVNLNTMLVFVRFEWIVPSVSSTNAMSFELSGNDSEDTDSCDDSPYL